MPRLEINRRRADPRNAATGPMTGGRDTRLYWLGQAGFLIISGSRRILIDPYLSDSLAKKYAGTVFPHRRMMSPPIQPVEITEAMLVLCTHRHTDHMDPKTLAAIAANNRDSRFVVPGAELDQVLSIGIPRDQVLTISAFETITIAPDISITAIPAAHEDFKLNGAGEHHFLGFILHLDTASIYHSGDCIPYPGLIDTLRQHAIDVALLPVNGRDDYRRENNVPGNFTLEEAIDICRQAEIPYLFGHHFGMFDFNTIDRSETEVTLAGLRSGTEVDLCRIGIEYQISTV